MVFELLERRSLSQTWGLKSKNLGNPAHPDSRHCFGLKRPGLFSPFQIPILPGSDPGPTHNHSWPELQALGREGSGQPPQPAFLCGDYSLCTAQQPHLEGSSQGATGDSPLQGMTPPRPLLLSGGGGIFVSWGLTGVGRQESWAQRSPGSKSEGHKTCPTCFSLHFFTHSVNTETLFCSRP